MRCSISPISTLRPWTSRATSSGAWPGAQIRVQNEAVLSVDRTLTTDAVGEVLFRDLPAGRYKFRASAPNHQEIIGRFTIKPGITVTQEVFLNYNLVTVEWSVTEIPLEDRYNINLNATYETDVPAPVVVLEPMSVNLPNMQPGEVFYGELTLTNYGLVRADDLKLTLPSTDPYFAYEFMVNVPKSLETKQRITIPYRITSLRSIDQGSAGDASGGGCFSYKQCGWEGHCWECANGYRTCGSSPVCWYFERGQQCGGSSSASFCPVCGGGGSGGGGGSSGSGGIVYTPLASSQCDCSSAPPQECRVCQNGKMANVKDGTVCADKGIAACTIDKCSSGNCNHETIERIAAYHPDPYGVDIAGLTQNTQNSLNCLNDAVSQADGTLTVTSAFRPQSYQNHLREVWNKYQKIKNWNSAKCQTVKTNILAEERLHDIQYQPAVVSNHSRGTVFDASWSLPRGINIDTLARNCNLSRCVPGDYVHFCGN